MVGPQRAEKEQVSGAVAKCHNALLAQIAATLRLTGTALDFVLTINALYRIVFSVITASHPRICIRLWLEHGNSHVTMVSGRRRGRFEVRGRGGGGRATELGTKEVLGTLMLTRMRV